MSRPISMLQAARTALVVVDVQEKLLPAIFEKERVVRNSLLLLRLAEALELPVVLTTQYKKGLGETIPEILEAAPGIEPIDKVSFGCFGSSAFVERLENIKQRDQLVVAGIEAHICVNQTVLGAIVAGYEVHVAGDATSSRTEANGRVGLSRMEIAGARISSAEMAIYELLGRSDTPAFKKMLPHLKG